MVDKKSNFLIREMIFIESCFKKNEIKRTKCNNLGFLHLNNYFSNTNFAPVA